MIRTSSKKKKRFKTSVLYKGVRTSVPKATEPPQQLKKVKSLKSVRRPVATPLIGIGYDLSPLERSPSQQRARPLFHRNVTPKPSLDRAYFPSIQVLTPYQPPLRYSPKLPFWGIYNRNAFLKSAIKRNRMMNEKLDISESSLDKLPSDTILFEEYI